MPINTFGPYSQVRQAGDLYFVSGQIGVDPATKQAASSIADQTRQVFANLEMALVGARLSLDNLVKTTVYLANMDDFTAVNDIYVTYFKGVPPARACVEVSCLPKVANQKILIEIEAVAYRAV